MKHLIFCTKQRRGKESRSRVIRRETVFDCLKAFAVTAAVAYLFYDSPWALLLAGLILPVYVRKKNGERCLKERRSLEKQFQDGLYSAAAALEAGYSVERAWSEAEKDLEQLYGNEEIFVKKLHQMNQKITVNETIERQILQFAVETDIDSIQSFAEIFSFAKRSGGNLTEIMKQASGKIRQSVQVQEEIQMMLTARKLEQNIMSIMPLGIVLYVRFGSPGYLDPLYHTASGIAVMTGCLGVYIGALLWADRIMRITV